MITDGGEGRALGCRCVRPCSATLAFPTFLGLPPTDAAQCTTRRGQSPRGSRAPLLKGAPQVHHVPHSLVRCVCASLLTVDIRDGALLEIRVLKENLWLCICDVLVGSSLMRRWECTNVLGHPKESYHQSVITSDSEGGTGEPQIITLADQPSALIFHFIVLGINVLMRDSMTVLHNLS